ncbi:hypothetical protein [Lewinella sp. 4G2]|uniref:hypothetical protein n=1 Tax=Lewinella sp. 4G2 TaxID=1803372 RepID=UPI0007B45CE8|nr:hypothetical protein [Lewinella sp. 4G2]OAV42858.1 hypothetical protein A3850_016655 [Lewinella sp. 4G2]
MPTLATVALVFLFSLSLSGQGVSLFDAAHASGDTLVVELEVDFKRLLRKKIGRSFLAAPATISFGGTIIPLSAKVRRRGNARLEQCALPGLKLRFNKDALRRAGYAGKMNDWKLVLPCYGRPSAQTFLRREAFAYDLYALLHDKHVRTIPARLKVGEREMPIFLIEHSEQIAARFGGYEYPDDRLSSRSLERESYVRLCLFNYLIQNTDFNVFNLHNLAVIGREGTDLFTPFPYDFDYSGLVGAPYAVPAEALGTDSIYERLWRGRNVTAAEIAQQVAYFESRRDDIYALVNSYFVGSKSERRRINGMVDSYYRDVKKLSTVGRPD